MPNWNKGQQQVLDSLNKNKNILVSAAAGSGKTAVLVERIIQTVLSGKADIDEILVVTFTRLAAAQMKDKIIQAIEKKASEDPEGDMPRQLSLAENADIMTIDSFCGKIVRENFNLAEMDPNFEIYDSDEVVLLKEDVIDKVFEEHYQKDDIFNELASYMVENNINDSTLKNYVLKIYGVSESFADSQSWLDLAANEASQENNKLVVDYMSFVKKVAGLYLRDLDRFIEILSTYENSEEVKEVEAAKKALDTLNDDFFNLTGFCNQKTLDDLSQYHIEWGRFQGKKVADNISEELSIEIGNLRDAYKGITKGIFSETAILGEIEKNDKFVKCMTQVVKDFQKMLMAEKAKVKKYEFSDINHAAYRILFDRDLKAPTEVGRKLSDYYKYIYIDEYQDSNDLQENILNAVARHDENGIVNNIFMVGDVKQSIYRFRLARPDLFVDKTEKYDLIGSEEADISTSKGTIINLNMNYRSRKEILDATNFVFENVMTADFGGIEYDEYAALHTPDMEDYQSLYPEAGEDINISGIPEVIIIDDKDTPDSDDEEDDAVPNEDLEITELSPAEKEAVVVGEKILEMVNGNEELGIKPLFIKNENYNPDRPESEYNSVYRKAEFSDIVILQRKLKGITPMLRIYEQMGIPVTVNNSTGYFDAIEIMSMLSVLRVIDNIKQDVPYTSMLLSHIGGLDESELAKIISHQGDSKKSVVDKCIDYQTEGDDPKIIAKLERINNFIAKWSKVSPYISISELIDQILTDTDFDTFVASMPDGNRRVANIKMLKVRAGKFESVRNGGLMDFIRYIDKCQINDVQFGEAAVVKNVGNTVQIISIHKSKGLEYPIVIAPRLKSKFMFDDMNSNVVVNSDYLIAMDGYTRLDNSIVLRTGSTKKEVMKLLVNNEMRAEEARLLYVAMTRAKEKLILVGCNTSDKKVIPMKSGCLLDFIKYAMKMKPYDGILDVKYVSGTEVEQSFKKEYVKRSLDYSASVKTLLELIDKYYDEIMGENPYDYVYPYSASTEKKSKLSVSDIKHEEMERNLELRMEAEPVIQDAYQETDQEEIRESQEENREEALKKEEARKRAATRGTVIHSLFEHLDYSNVSSKTDLTEEFRRILQDERYSEEERELVNVEKLSSFYSEETDGLFSRMKNAFAEGKLRREQQFIAGLKPEDIPGFENQDEYSKDDRTVIQGIIDAFFYEGDCDDIVLVDYKTDNVKDGDELLGRYASQMYLYATILEKLTDSKVKEIILYSTRFGEVKYPGWRDYLKNR